MPNTSRLDTISVRGARTHNLKNIDVDIPRDKLIVITGLSGSGKSSLAFDTIYADGQRRYVESLSAYARQFLSLMEKPDVDHIEGLSPAISIEQKSTSHNPRSTVGTVTEISDYLRLLFARVGIPRCPDHGIDLEAQTVSQMVDRVCALPEGGRYMLLAPIVIGRKGEHIKLMDEMRAQGFIRARIDGEVIELDDPPELNPRQKHDIEVVVDRFKIRADIEQRLAESFDTAIGLTNGIARISPMDASANGGEDITFSARMACTECGYSLTELEPKLFSFNAPSGACSDCDGLGVKQFFDPNRVVLNPTLSLAGGAIPSWDRRNPYLHSLITSVAKHYGFDIEMPWQELSKEHKKIILRGSGEAIELSYKNEKGMTYSRKKPFEGVIPNMERRYRETESTMVRDELVKYQNSQSCPSCEGQRLNRGARNVFVAEHNLPKLTELSIDDAFDTFTNLQLQGQRAEIASKILKEINERLGFLVNVGLGYLSLARSADTLSGGEAQRIRLASQIGAGLVGVMYVLDEPSIGLHQRDNERLLSTLTRLRDLGNTVIVVEHDEDAIRAADHIIDMGPGAGEHGGEVIASGTADDVLNTQGSLTADYLNGNKAIRVPEKREARQASEFLRLSGASGNNLKGVTLEIPKGMITCVTGVSGSGKSTLINDTLYPAAATALNGATTLTPAAHDTIEGLDLFDKVIDIDQSPIGRTPRSNPATYTGLFTPIRELFAATPEARARGYKSGRFSFNVKGGRCEACQGDGVIKVEMHFLPDVYVPCDTCHGKRYNRETMDIRYRGKNISEVLEMTVEDALPYFEAVPSLKRKIQTLLDVGLSYIRLGQSATTLSGGEAQRVKLAKELSKRDTGRTLYILDEPTTGLHFHDIAKLLEVIEELRTRGNTVVIIEHNLDVVKTADWIVDMGPEGGDGGGTVVATGTPLEITTHPASHTGQFLKSLM